LAGVIAVGSFSGPAIAQDNVLVSAIGTNPPHLNRLLTTEVATSTISYALYDSLVVLDKDYVPIPHLATAWQASEDATEYRFTIREGVKWHDGRPLTAEDVAFTLRTYLPLAPQTSILKNFLQEIRAESPTTVYVKLNKPFAPFVNAIAGTPIVPKHVFGDGRDIATHPANLAPIGSGPFKLKSFESGDRVVLVRNDEYWGEKTDVTTMVFPVIPDQNTRILALASGDIHYLAASYIDKSAYKRLMADNRMAALPVLGGVNTVTAHVNAARGPLEKFEVRKAIYQGLNREMIAGRGYYGFGTPSRGAIPKDITWAVSADVDFNKDLPYDPVAAGKLLDGAGYPIGANGTRFSIDLAYIAEYGTLAAAAGIMKSNLEEIGIKVNLIGEEFSVWAERTYKKLNYDLSIVFYTSYEDPSIGVTRVYVCNPDKVMFRNSSGLCDETLDRYFADAGSTSDREKRRTAFAKAEKRITELMHAYPMVDETSLHFGRKDLWDLEAAHATHPIKWSLVKRAK
jgi:peptide/nickel transport system substrate-binding protein